MEVCFVKDPLETESHPVNWKRPDLVESDPLHGYTNQNRTRDTYNPFLGVLFRDGLSKLSFTSLI